MKLNDEVVIFNFAGIPMAGCLATGALIGLTPNGLAICNRLKEEGFDFTPSSDEDKALLECLEKGGFLGRSKATPLESVYLHVTQRCNLKCTGCYSDSSDRPYAKDASLDDMKRAIENVAEAGARKFIISGGEPFLRSDLPEIIKFIKIEIPQSEVVVLSNGTRISDKQLKEMASYLNQIAISFDGWSEQSIPFIRKTQRFNQLIDAVKRIKQHEINVHIIPTIHAKNYVDIPHYLDLAHKLGATINFSILTCDNLTPDTSCLNLSSKDLEDMCHILLQHNHSLNAAQDDFPGNSTLRARRNCGAGAKSISIGYDGTIYPCHMLHRPEYAMGNAFCDSVSNALHSSNATKITDFTPDKNSACAKCNYKHLCGGGCRARALIQFGSLQQIDPYCQLMQCFYRDIGEKLKTSMGSYA